MKRIITLILTIGLCLAFVGCGTKEAGGVVENATDTSVVAVDNNATTESPTAEPAETPEATETSLLFLCFGLH